MRVGVHRAQLGLIRHHHRVGASSTIPGPGYVVVRSNGTTWDVIEGAYSSASVGLASYRWNAASGAWRLIAYDTGWRDVSADMTAAAITKFRQDSWAFAAPWLP